jgi:hypothetical protein
MDLDREHPGVKSSMIKALQNVAPRHLLDTRLNPPAELRAKTTAVDVAAPVFRPTRTIPLALSTGPLASGPHEPHAE